MCKKRIRIDGWHNFRERFRGGNFPTSKKLLDLNFVGKRKEMLEFYMEECNVMCAIGESELVVGIILERGL